MKIRVSSSLLLNITFFFLFTSSVSATTYFVSESGSDANNGETVNTAWNTIQHAVSSAKIRPGDTIVVKDGLYRENILWNSSTGSSGRENNPITLRAENIGKARISGIGTTSEFEIKDVSYITVEGIRLENYKGNGFSIQQNNKEVVGITLKNCEIYNQKSRGAKGYWNHAIVVAKNNKNFDMKNITIDGCRIEKTETWSVVEGGTYPHNENITFHGGVTHSRIINNTIIEGSFIGIDLIGLPPGTYAETGGPSYIKVANNNLVSLYDPRGNVVNNAIYTDRPGTFILFEKNKVTASLTNGLRLGAEPYRGESQEHSNIIARGNEITTSVGAYLGQGSPGGYETSGSNPIRYVNNIAFVHNKLKSTSSNLGTIVWAHTKDSSVKNNVLNSTISKIYSSINPANQNKPAVVDNWESDGNLFVSPGNQASFAWGGTTTYNTFQQYSTATGQDENSLFGNFDNSQEQGVELTLTTQAGSNTRVIPVKDTKYFYDGWGIEGEVGDKIMVGSTQVRITNVNHATKTLTVDRTLTFSTNTPVNYYYEGSRPTMGLLPDGFYDKGDVTTTPTPTPTGSPNSPTPTSAPSCPAFSQGNATCDSAGTIDLTDFTCWKSEFLTGTAPGGCPGGADFDTSGGVDILDFAIWQVSYARG